MTMDSLLADWDWEDPDALAVTLAKFTAMLARCETLERLVRPLPVTRQDFGELGLTGIEFAVFKTRHPAGLGTDLVGLHTPAMTTEPGHLYLADGTSYFTQLDIAEKLPFGDGCVDWVYAEHLIEHVPLLVAIRWLTEVRRILAPGGLLRITTPDLSTYARGHVTRDGFFAKQRRRLHVMRVGPPMPERPAFMVNQIFYLYGHRWLYDLDELRYVLARAGFASAVQECAYGAGTRADVAALDTVLRKHESIYVEVTA
jgi:predicted SAM-dependent methyltransferase